MFERRDLTNDLFLLPIYQLIMSWKEVVLSDTKHQHHELVMGSYLSPNILKFQFYVWHCPKGPKRFLRGPPKEDPRQSYLDYGLRADHL